MNDTLGAVILGLVQGLTEFLPVSSTAHLILVTDVLKLDPKRFGLSFDIALHIGTALAVLLYFARIWLGLLADVLARRWRLPLLVIVASIPGAVAGVFLESAVQQAFRGPLLIAVGLIAGSILFVIAERVATRRLRWESLRLGDVVFMGLAQALALLPGISRSGITISAGLVRGLERADATRFSFLMATPIVLGAGLKTLVDARKAADLGGQLDIVAIGFAVSFASGLAAVAFMVRFLRSHSLGWFVGYRLVLAAAILVAVAAGIL